MLAKQYNILGKRWRSLQTQLGKKTNQTQKVYSLHLNSLESFSLLHISFDFTYMSESTMNRTALVFGATGK